MNFMYYIDPSIGMMIAQAALAAAAGFVLFYKNALATIKGWLGIYKKKDESDFDSTYDDQDLNKD